MKESWSGFIVGIASTILLLWLLTWAYGVGKDAGLKEAEQKAACRS